jgi:membrane-associated protease RseP (regulator of RpoE activity)
MFRTAALSMLAMSMGAGAYAASADTAPITITVESSIGTERGLSRILSGASSGDVDATARDVERDLQQLRWLRVVTRDPEVRVTVDRRGRTETSRSTDKKTGGVTVNHRYSASATVQIGGSRDRLDADTSYSQGPNATRDDSEQFDKVAKELANNIARRITQDLDALRPNRPQAGFDHKAKYKMLFRGDGLEVLAVQAGSPAEVAGMMVGDRIRSIDGEKGTDQMNSRALSWWADLPGSRYNLEVEHNKQRIVQLELLPQAQWGGRSAAPVREPAHTAASREPAHAAASHEPSAPRSSTPAASSEGSGVEIKPGMTQAQVIHSLGEPQKKVAFGAKILWTYPGFTVTFMGGKVTDVK